ncbi:MAG: hypothetical protein ACXABY_03025 [Candidatus Thorarchaeota archaeon]|jgi:hypothetical protein
MGRVNLPGIWEEKQDGNLTIVPVNNNPIVLAIGTAGQGQSETLYRVEKVSDASREFGKSGNLTRGLYEAAIAGALNIRLFRIGATAASLILGGTGLTIETVAKDDSAGTDYKLFWDDSELRLYVWRVSDDELVYDSYPAYPNERVDLGEVSVSGTAASNGSDIHEYLGTGSGPLTLAATHGVDGSVYTAGTDGLNLSRMEVYEALFNAYKLLEDQEIDIVVPMNVYLDDLNVMDMNAAEVTTRALASLSDYPTSGASDDVLGKVYTEEYQGLWYFWWWFPSSPNADVDTTFTTDTGADIFPSEGSASATTTIDGTALTGSDFHEVNFAYQLANFCYQQGIVNMDMTGSIGVLPPNSFSLKDAATWVGTLPTTSLDANGKRVITVNGTGLLGNKFMSGRLASGGSTGTPGFTVGGVAGLYHGGFIATDDQWLDGTQQEDDNEHLIDIGKYISVVATYPVLANPSSVSSYAASGAASYAGFYSILPASSAPTNKTIGNLRLPYRLNASKLDLLAGQHFVTFHQKRQGVVVSDGPTAARPDSDYKRLSTVRQVKSTVDAVRDAGEPFLGEGMTGSQMAALETAIDRVIALKVKQGILRRGEHQLIVTPQLRVLGQAIVELKLVPAFELRQITVTVALAAV